MNTKAFLLFLLASVATRAADAERLDNRLRGGKVESAAAEQLESAAEQLEPEQSEVEPLEPDQGEPKQGEGEPRDRCTYDDALEKCPDSLGCDPTRPAKFALQGRGGRIICVSFAAVCFQIEQAGKTCYVEGESESAQPEER